MRMMQRLRAWTETRFDTELESYLASWRRNLDRSNDELRHTMSEIATRTAGPDGMPGADGLTGAAAYDLFTRVLVGIEESLTRRMIKHPSGLWLIRSRQHLVCDLLSLPPTSDFEVRGRMTAYQRLPRTLAAFAGGADTDPSDGEGAGRRVPDDMPVDVHVLMSLLDWYGLCLLFRRRIALGGRVVPDRSMLHDVDLPGAELPPQLEMQLPNIRVREERGSSPMLANLGLDVPIRNLPDFGTAEVDFGGAAQYTSFFLAGVRHFDAFTVGTKHVSDVQVFGPVWFDARDVLEPLTFLHEEIVEMWDMSPLEVMAGATVLCLFARNAWLTTDTRNAVERMFRTRALMTASAHEVERYMQVELPKVTAALGGRLDDADVAAAATKALRQFVEVPQNHPPHRDGTQLRMYGPAPFVVSDGDRLVIDLYAMWVAFSSLVDSRPFTGRRVEEKGRWFEDAVRRSLVGADATISSVPTMEREFRDRGTNIGEADVVARVGDTAFVIECKSRRASKTDDCVTLDEALRRSRDVMTWARQARRTAEYLATHPRGPNHEVPADIDWIIPIVCSQLLEADWHEPAESYLLPGEITIFMTPIEIREFIAGDRWRSEGARKWQYRVTR
jgi:Holliday junction resolvase-like predicted endonuclease